MKTEEEDDDDDDWSDDDDDEDESEPHLSLGAVPDGKYLCILVPDPNAKRKREEDGDDKEEGAEAKEEPVDPEVKPDVE